MSVRTSARRPNAPLVFLLALLVAAPALAVDRTSVRAEPAEPGCGTVFTAEEAAEYLRRLATRGPSELDDVLEPYYVRIAPHIVRHSDGTGGLPVERYYRAVEDANGHFAPAGIVFFTYGPIDFIDSDEFYTTTTLAEIDQLRQTNTVPDAINIYFTENLNFESGALCGISAFTFSSVQAIAMRNSCTANDAGLGNHSTFSHEIGHFFDLFHTHETFYGDELVDGSNCDVAGDLICDTPADPRLGSSNVNSACEYTGTSTDANGDAYVPDPALLMSYSLKHCRDDFSPESYLVAKETLLIERPELLLLDPVAAPDGLAALPATGVWLSVPRPNPASGATRLTFALDAAAQVTISVHDVRGALVSTLARSPYGPGEHVVVWNGRNREGVEAAPGIYFARLQARDRVLTQKIQRVR